MKHCTMGLKVMNVFVSCNEAVIRFEKVRLGWIGQNLMTK